MNLILLSILATFIDLSSTTELIDEEKLSTSETSNENLKQLNINYRSIDCTNLHGTFCDNDCYTLLTCHAQKQPTRIDKCASISPNKPFCQPGTNSCSSKSCSSVSFGFTCTSTENFPDLTNCSQYYQCNYDGTPQIRVCPKNYFFDSVLKNCKSNTNGINDCVEIDCTLRSNWNSYIAYLPNPMYYIYCSEDLSIILKCHTDQHVFVEGYGCQFNCVKEGRFRDPDDYSRYFECSYDCGLKQHHQTCMHNLYYNSYVGACT